MLIIYTLFVPRIDGINTSDSFLFGNTTLVHNLFIVINNEDNPLIN
jgi:hypothetical protein